MRRKQIVVLLFLATLMGLTLTIYSLLQVSSFRSKAEGPRAGAVVIPQNPSSESSKNTLQLQTFPFITLTPTPTLAPTPTTGQAQPEENKDPEAKDSSDNPDSKPGSTTLSSLLPNPVPADPPGVASTKNSIINVFKKYPQSVDVYKQAAAKTGIPWQVFAAIHYREGGANPNNSLVSGRKIGAAEPDVPRTSCPGKNPRGVTDGLAEAGGGGCVFSSLLDTALYSAMEIRGKIKGGNIDSYQSLVTAASRYNGGGNKNCGRGVAYAGCPALFYGEDDPYALNFFDTKHAVMYVIFCSDHTKCSPPKKNINPGVVTIIKWLVQSYP